VSHPVKGVLIPQGVHRVVRLESSARFILLVEKDAAFQKLLDEGILERLGPCILITVSNCSKALTLSKLSIFITILVSHFHENMWRRIEFNKP
jgi:DNA topoisomerase VI subunit A